MIFLQTLQDLQTDQHSRNSLLATYIQYQCNLPHPLLTSNQNSPDYENAPILTRSNSNPDLEVAHYHRSAKGLDRASSMRVPISEPLSPNYPTVCQRVVHQVLTTRWYLAKDTYRNLAMRNAWFFFELIIKSMVEHLAHTHTLEAPRKNRFPEHFLKDVSTLVHIVTQEIISQSSNDIGRAHKLNAALAFFFFDLLFIADRGFVLGLICSYNKEMQMTIHSSSVSHVLVELKLESIRIICSHEHYLALNLPFGTPFMSSGASISPSPSVTSSTSQNSFISGPSPSQERVSHFAELSSEYRQHHYLTGLVLTDVATVLLDMK